VAAEKYQWGTFYWYGKEVREAVRKHFRLKVYQAAEKVRAQVQRNVSASSKTGRSMPGDFPHADTGALRNSVFATVNPATLSFTVGTSLLYGYYLEFGTTTPRTVHARAGGTLRWLDPATGKVVFARWVVIPPLAPRPFLRRTLNEMRPWLRSHFESPMDLRLTFKVA
jgi:hypothetical protein